MNVYLAFKDSDTTAFTVPDSGTLQAGGGTGTYNWLASTGKWCSVDYYIWS